MKYDDIKEWVQQLKENNNENEDVVSVVESLELILARPFGDLTIDKLNKALRQLVEISSKPKITYPLYLGSTLTAGVLYESFQKERVQKEFSQSYPEILVEQKEGPVALLDVDATLIIRDEHNEGEILNQNLLDALKQRNIKDVYLFTDMYSEGRQLENRKSLIADLEEQGFRVHGVISPSDYTWSIKEEIQQLNELFVRKNISLKSNLNLDRIQELFDEISALNEWAEGKSELPDLGQAYREVSQRQKHQREDLDHSINCKIALDLISLRRATASPKGIMFEHFLKKKPDWITDIFVFDDKKENLTAVKETLKGEYEDLTVSTFYVKNDTTTADFVFEMDVDANPINKEPLNEETRAKIVAELDKYIQSHKKIGFWLFHNKQGLTEEKVKNAEMFKEILESEDIETIGDIKKLIHDVKNLNKFTESKFNKTYLQGAGKFDSLLDEFNGWLESPELTTTQIFG